MNDPGAPKLLSRRSAGVLLPLFSLPGRHGCGDLGPGARRFVDWLAAAGQGWWQLLPVGPFGSGCSPYSASSSWAGNPLYVSPEDLVRQGWLNRGELRAPRGLAGGRVNYCAAAAHRERLLRRAHERFRASRAGSKAKFERFRSAERGWLPDFALFAAWKSSSADAPWQEWPQGIRARKASALRSARNELAGEIAYQEFLQFQFHEQWQALRSYASRRGVRLLGDLPLFVDLDSCDVWARPELFELDRSGRPRCITGVPPDSFSDDGQLWGHPHYHWKHHEAEGFRWWRARLEAQLARFDVVRLDHFLGLARVWKVRAGARSARKGRWESAPGRKLLRAVRRSIGELPFVAEDLGAVSPEAVRLRDDFGLPGMLILQNAFGEAGSGDLPHRYPPNAVAYTGTHDHDTAMGWYRSAPAEAKRRARSFAGGPVAELSWNLVRMAYASPANTVVVPVADLLGLGSSARINLPGTVAGNWRWRVPAGALSARLAARLCALTESCDRASA